MAKGASRAVLAMAYSFFRLATGIEAKRIVPPEPILKSFGLNPLKRAEFNLGLLYAEL